MKQLKIALIHYAAPPIIGGVESVMGQHARLMAADGHQVTIFAGRGAQFDERVTWQEIPLLDSAHPRVLRAKKSLNKGKLPAEWDGLQAEILQALRQHLAPFDVIIAHNLCSLHKNLAATAALRQYAAENPAQRLVLWHHDLAWCAPRYRAELHPGWPWNLIAADWPETNRRHVVVSQFRREELSTLMGLPPEQIAVVPSGLEAAQFYKLHPFTAGFIQKSRLLEAWPLLLLPVRITRRKNIELAIKSLAALKEQFPQAALVVTGPPGAHNPANQQYFEELARLRDSLGLRPQPGAGGGAYLMAEIENDFLPNEVIYDFYRVADALFMPSQEEGFGIPILEAGLEGMPIFCSDILPFREIAGENVTYFQLNQPPAEVAALMAGQLARVPALRHRARVRQTYTWEGIYRTRILPLLSEVPHE